MAKANGTLLQLGGGMSMKLATNICHVSGNLWKRFSRSEVKVMCGTDV